MHKQSLIYVAGHRGLVGFSIYHVLESQGYSRILTRTRAGMDLFDGAAVDAFFNSEKPVVGSYRPGGRNTAYITKLPACCWKQQSPARSEML